MTDRKIQREPSQEDSVVSADSLQDTDSEFERVPLAKPALKSQRQRSPLTRKFSDPDPIERVSDGFEHCLLSLLTCAVPETEKSLAMSKSFST